MKLLFVPVSAPRGIGEYARAKEIALAVSGRWPHAQVHFVLSRAAPYAAESPFPKTLLPSSPTFHSREVAALISSYRPDLVIFDNAGRTLQLRAAHRAGARIIYVSSRPRQRRKAFRLSWMRLLDEHWIAYPEFIAGPLTPIERLKLKLLGRPTVRYLDTIMPDLQTLRRAELIASFGLQPGSYVVVIPGGGTPHPGAENAPQVMAEAAARLARHGHRTVLVGIGAPPGAGPLLVPMPRISMSELTALMSGAKLVVTNGGDTLLQALACARACVASPIAHDQAERIARCKSVGLVVHAPLNAGELERAVLELLTHPRRLEEQSARAAQSPVTNGMQPALEAIAALVPA